MDQTKMKKLTLEDNMEINILLLGETGVGKSTCINSIANYLSYKDFNEALAKNPKVLIPTKFNLIDKDFVPHNISIGDKDLNEHQEAGDAATQDVKTYLFPLGSGKTKIRLIDTPGMADPRGMEQDDKNCEYILSYIGQLHELHAICLLFKPNESRLTVTFEYCVNQILSRLDKSAAENIIFVLTNTKGTNYKPGETLSILKRVASNIKTTTIDIKVNENVFCLENEPFRVLAALHKDVNLDERSRESAVISWKHSYEECWKLIHYIIGSPSNDGLKPHFVKSTNAINEARRMIICLSKPMADISELISDNIRILERREKELNGGNLNLFDLKAKLYVPVIDLKVMKLGQPATVCTSATCKDIIVVENMQKNHFKQRCHDPCHLKNVPKELIGAPELIYCASMDRTTQTCRLCHCPISTHQHVYYMTEFVDNKVIDRSIEGKITSLEAAMQEAKRVIRNSSRRRDALQQEQQKIIECMAKFAHFLKANAITPFNDSYRKYIDYIITRERSNGNETDFSFIDHMTDVLARYDKIKESFDKAIESNGKKPNSLKPKDISNLINDIYKLEFNGKKIKELFDSQKEARKKEHKHSEYIHDTKISSDKNKERANKSGNMNHDQRTNSQQFRADQHPTPSNENFNQNRATFNENNCGCPRHWPNCPFFIPPMWSYPPNPINYGNPQSKNFVPQNNYVQQSEYRNFQAQNNYPNAPQNFCQHTPPSYEESYRGNNHNNRMNYGRPQFQNARPPNNCNHQNDSRNYSQNTPPSYEESNQGNTFQGKKINKFRNKYFK